MFEFMIKRQLANHNLETVEGRVAALRAAAPTVAGIRDSSLGVGYMRKLAGWLGLDPSEVARAVTSARNVASRASEAARAAQRTGPEAESAPQESGPSITQLPTDPATRLERDALMAILQYPTGVGRDLVERASRVSFANQTLAVVRDAVATSLDHLASPEWLAAVTREVPEPFVTLVQQLAVAPIPERPEQIELYCQGVAAALIDRSLLRRKADLLGALQRTDAAADPERHSSIQRELVAVEAERRSLRSD